MKKILYPLFAFFISTTTFGQSEDVDNFINDILLIAGEFSAPAADGVGFQAGAGWFSSASTLEKWDLRFSLHGNALLIPSERKSFRVTNSDLKLLELQNSESANLPTAFGGVNNEVLSGTINFLGEEIPVEFDAIDGIGRDFVPHAFVQLAVGVGAGTEVTVRAMPEVTIDGVTATTYGLGAKHNLSQYFNPYYQEGIQVALGLAYSKLKVDYAFTPQGAEGIVLLDEIDVDANSILAEFMASKSWGLFEVFGAAGIMSSNFQYTFGGNGQYLGEVNNQVDTLEDSIFQFKGDLGFNVSYSRFRLSTVATLGQFFNINMGLAVDF